MRRLPNTSPTVNERPRLYRGRRSTWRRMIIPGVLAAILTGGAMGAAASYITSHVGSTHRPAAASQGPNPVSRPPHASTSRTAAAIGGHRTSHPSSRGAGATSASRVTTGQALNDQAYALIRRGDASAAIPLLRRAVLDLRGVGPTDPYEAYANYNLGYALLATGDCAAALRPLGVANRLETSPLVDRAIHRASACAPPGS